MEDLRPRDEREARAWYCADAFPPARWGPSPTGRERARRQTAHDEAVDRKIDELLARPPGPAGDAARARLARRHAETR